MKIGNWHIIHDRELRQIRELDIKLKRKFSPDQIASILDGKGYYSKGRVQKEKVAA